MASVTTIKHVWQPNSWVIVISILAIGLNFLGFVTKNPFFMVNILFLFPIFIFLIRMVVRFRDSFLREFLSAILMAIPVFFVILLYTHHVELRFWLFRSQLDSAVNLVNQNQFVSTSQINSKTIEPAENFSPIRLNNSPWWLEQQTIQIAVDGSNHFIFFELNDVILPILSKCGYVFTKTGTLPTERQFSNFIKKAPFPAIRFSAISQNWLYGCATYDAS